MTLVLTMLVACGSKLPQLGKSFIDDVIAAMTLEEKAHLVVGTEWPGLQVKAQ